VSRVSKLLLAMSIAALWPALGCGSSGGTAPVRMLNASPGNPTLNGYMNSSLFANSVSYASASSYVNVVAGSPTLRVAPPAATMASITQTLSLVSGTSYTVMVAGYPSTLAATLLTDNNSPPSAENMNLRVINASPSLGTADVYVVRPGTSLTTISPTVSALNFLSASSYVSLAAGNYEIEFTPAGRTVVLMNSGVLSFSAGQVRTVVGLNGAVTGYTTAVLSDLN
jgi:trimeric autotransporter adhesin